MKLAADLCFKISKYLLIRNDSSVASTCESIHKHDDAKTVSWNPEISDEDSYANWRDNELEDQFLDHFACEQVAGKRVLDFGCGTGNLCKLSATCGAATVDGVDLNGRLIEFAQRNFSELSGYVNPNFHVADNTDTIEFEDEAFDVILCFDVVEHILQYREIISEWRRILTSGGRVLIWWQPYYHPWGHHLQSLIPIPWAHIMFSNKTLAEVVCRIKRLPEYNPRWWDFDSNGKRIYPDPEKINTETLGDLNRLTIRRFEKICNESRLNIVRRDMHAFTGSKIVELISGLLSRLPFINEHFTAYLIYELEKCD